MEMIIILKNTNFPEGVIVGIEFVLVHWPQIGRIGAGSSPHYKILV